MSGSKQTVSKRPPVLVVQDYPEIIEMVGTRLRHERIPYALMVDREGALDWLSAQRPAMVVLDWHRPRVGGSHMLSAIRKRHGPALPVLVLSTPAGAELAQYAGADAFLRKPYFISDLVRMIKELLAAPRSAARASTAPRSSLAKQ